MTLTRARSLDEALCALRATPGAVVLAGGTDLLVALNARTIDPPALVALRRIDELREVSGTTYGALITYAHLLDVGTPLLRATAAAVGTPASRNAGTIGGALGTASATADLPTALMAAGARVSVASLDGRRTVDIHELTRARDEIIVGVDVPPPAGPQTYLKLGLRQAAVGATVSCALTVDSDRRTVRLALAGVAGRPERAQTAENYVRDHVEWRDGLPVVGETQARRFAELTRAVTFPREAARASREYRRHAAGVLAARALTRVGRAA